VATSKVLSCTTDIDANNMNDHSFTWIESGYPSVVGTARRDRLAWGVGGPSLPLRLLE
jgi:hypothetical protein